MVAESYTHSGRDTTRLFRSAGSDINLSQSDRDPAQ